MNFHLDMFRRSLSAPVIDGVPATSEAVGVIVLVDICICKEIQLLPDHEHDFDMCFLLFFGTSLHVSCVIP